MPAAVPPFVAVTAIIVASIFASPCTAGPPVAVVDAGPAKPPPLVENLPAASPAAQDYAQVFIRSRCEDISGGRTEDEKMCYDLLLPYAASINGSYNRAAIAGVTVMVSKLTSFATASPPPQGECIQVVNGAISGAKEALSKLARLDAIGDDKVDYKNQDLVAVTIWIAGVNENFVDKCRRRDDGGAHATTAAAALAWDSVSTAYQLVTTGTPYWNPLPSPDGSNP